MSSDGGDESAKASRVATKLNTTIDNHSARSAESMSPAGPIITNTADAKTLCGMNVRDGCVDVRKIRNILV